jgi:hypothetical protein
VASLGQAQPLAIEELAALEQVDPIRLERVSRQSPLELQIGEEVEDQRLAPAGRERGGRI